MSNWGAASIQLVWFTGEARHKDASAIYELVAGEEAETVQTSRSPSPANPFLSVAAGTVSGRHMRATVQAGRIDLIVEPVAKDGPPQFMDDTAEWMDRLVRAARDPSLDFPTVNRLALVLNLGVSVGSYTQGFSLINEKLGGAIPFNDGSDFMLQVNRRAEIDDIIINRLLRFNISGIQQVQFAFGIPAVIPFSTEIYVNMFMIDVNILPTTRAIDQVEQSRIWKVLLNEAVRLREAGNLEALQ